VSGLSAGIAPEHPSLPDALSPDWHRRWNNRPSRTFLRRVAGPECYLNQGRQHTYMLRPCNTTMRHIRIELSDSEYEELEAAKEQRGLTWRGVLKEWHRETIE